MGSWLWGVTVEELHRLLCQIDPYFPFLAQTLHVVLSVAENETAEHRGSWNTHNTMGHLLQWCIHSPRLWQCATGNAGQNRSLTWNAGLHQGLGQVQRMPTSIPVKTRDTVIFRLLGFTGPGIKSMTKNLMLTFPSDPTIYPSLPTSYRWESALHCPAQGLGNCGSIPLGLQG